MFVLLFWLSSYKICSSLDENVMIFILRKGFKNMLLFLINFSGDTQSVLLIKRYKEEKWLIGLVYKMGVWYKVFQLRYFFFLIMF